MGGRSKVGDAYSARYARSCAIVALSVGEVADELTEAAELEDEDELEAAEELARDEELDPWAAALSLLDTPRGPLESALAPPPHDATRAEPADKPANLRKSRR
jgi:hypothetical protein